MKKLIAAVFVFGMLAAQSVQAAPLAGSAGATSAGMHGDVFTYDSDNFVESQMQRRLISGGYWTVKTWECPSSARTNCTQVNSTRKVHLSGLGDVKTIGTTGTPGKWYYTSVYNEAGTLLLRTDAVKLN